MAISLMKQIKKTPLLAYGLVILVIILAVVKLGFVNSANAHKYDDFAKCLADKNITMYGADWCSHCQNEKKALRASFKLIPYVECPKDPKKCLDSGIERYPTWVFPDGKKLVGEQGVLNLSKESGCQLPNN